MGYVDDLAVLAGLAPGTESRQSTNVHAATGIAHGDSSDGRVLVDMGGVSITGDGSQYVSVPTMADVRDGDEVHVELVGADGTAKSMVVTGVVGGGDRTRVDVDNAVSDASQAVDTAGKAADTAEDAKSTATDARDKAAALATVIHDGDDGVSVGRSADGGVTYPQGRTRQSSDAFEVLDDGGKTLSSFSKDKVRLGIGSPMSEIDMVDGHGKIFGYLDPQTTDPGDGITELRISSDKFLTLHGANEALLYATPSSTVVEYQNSTHATINVSSEIDDHTFSSDVRLEATAVDETDSDYETKSTITMLASDGATLNGAQILTAPTVLFYNAARALNTAIPLSDSAGNYERLKIFYKSDDRDYCSVEVYHPDGKTVALQIARPTYEYAPGAAPVMFLKSKIVKISGATIDTVKESTYGGGTNYLRMQKNLSGEYEMADKIGIIRVEGYKW